jgi:hypothetical protein
MGTSGPPCLPSMPCNRKAPITLWTAIHNPMAANLKMRIGTRRSAERWVHKRRIKSPTWTSSHNTSIASNSSKWTANPSNPKRHTNSRPDSTTSPSKHLAAQREKRRKGKYQTCQKASASTARKTKAHKVAARKEIFCTLSAAKLLIVSRYRRRSLRAIRQ